MVGKITSNEDKVRISELLDNNRMLKYKEKQRRELR
jgi:hypothetical protein